MLGLLFMQTTCAAMDAFVRELEDVDGFAGPPVVMPTAEEARFVARCVEAAIRVKKLLDWEQQSFSRELFWCPACF